MSGRVHRHLRWRGDTQPMMTGKDVRELQEAINARARGDDKRGLTKLVEDGDFGRQTNAVGRKAARSLGVNVAEHGMGRRAQRVVRRPWLRTPSERRREKRWMKARAEERKLERLSRAHRDGNKVTGGTARQRAVFAAMEAAKLYYSGKSHRFYSQPGRWTVDQGITGEHGGDRSDCSQFVTAMAHSAGLPDPNGNSYRGGYTGTLFAHLKEITRQMLEPGDLIGYGVGAGHHVEEWVGNGDGKTAYKELDRAGSTYRDRTVGHGSPPVDYGDIDMMGGARFFRLDLS